MIPAVTALAIAEVVTADGFAAWGTDVLAVRLQAIGATEAAIAVHHGPFEDVDRTYADVGTVVAAQAIGVDGPIREYYPDGLDGPGPHRIEICWPVFRTSPGAAR